MYYVDTDFFLALLKEKDWLKEAAINFANSNPDFSNKNIGTSSYTLLEIWFYLERNKINDRKIVHAIRELVSEILVFSDQELEGAMILKEKYGLNIGDSIHATFALDLEGIISSDDSFDKITNLKRIDFTK